MSITSAFGGLSKGFNWDWLTKLEDLDEETQNIINDNFWSWIVE